MATLALPADRGWLAALKAGFHASWLTILLIVAINTGFAAIMSIEDPRPFWHPLITAQCFGLAIAYAVNVASPWDEAAANLAAVRGGGHRHDRRATRSCVAIKGYVLGITGYTPSELVSDSHKFQWTLLSGFSNGLFVSLFFLLKFRETRAAAALHRAEAERHRLSSLALESELKLMQAQVEPHFLFNTLASVQYLTETDPPQATALLGPPARLSARRAAAAAQREHDARPGDRARRSLPADPARCGWARASRSRSTSPTSCARIRFRRVLLISIVENAVTHGLEPQAEGGDRPDRGAPQRRAARRRRHRHGRRPRRQHGRPGQGVGLANVRERIAALFGARGRFTLDESPPHGARATIEIPLAGA